MVNVRLLKKILMWTGIVILVGYIGLVIYRIPAVLEKQKTEETVTRIHAAKLTLADVMGENLPPPPDLALKDATIQGIDTNGNGIRDDVELAIFEKYPDSARVRAALLQYAKASQMYLTEVFNEETLVATIQEESRGSGCLFDTTFGMILTERNRVTQTLKTEVYDFSFNTDERGQKHEEVLKKYMTSHGDWGSSNCDIDLNLLSN